MTAATDPVRALAASTESDVGCTSTASGSGEEPRLLSSRRPARTIAKVVRARLLPLEKRAANDDPAQDLRSGAHEGYRELRLDEMIREIVRYEVRAEVARALTNAPAQPTHVSVAEYAAARSISVSTVRNAIRGGRLPALRFGAAVRVPVDAEIGRPVIATTDGHDASPATRADKILADRISRSLAKPSARRVA